MNITLDFKQKVIAALKDLRSRYGGSEKDFATQWDINPAVWSRIKNGETENVIKDTQWLTMGRNLDVSVNERVWKIAKTEVYKAISNDVNTCQQYSKAMQLVDDCGIGKTTTAKHLSKTLKNCFYVDGSQCKTKHLFTRALAKAIGVDGSGKLNNVKENIKYYLRMLTRPVIIIDEAGDFDYSVELDIKEYWNATEGVCGWYRMGADGLSAKINRGIANKKVGFRENQSRFGDKFTKIVPTDTYEESQFYRQLITDVLTVNINNKNTLPTILKKCLTRDINGKLGGLRRAETLLIIHDAE